ncbi:MAG: alkaline phosphatase D family protein [Rubrivivax sp.]
MAPASAAIVASDTERPQVAQGLQFGDMTLGNTMLWSRADRSARLFAEYSFDEAFSQPVRLVGPHALESTDFTARLDLAGLPADRTVYVRAWFESLTTKRASSEVLQGRFRTPALQRSVRFVWGGDTAGQGWGINPSFGGMKIYEQMRRVQPDFFLHSGDTIYADGPIAATVTAENGQTWQNIVTPEVAKVAETLDEFRGRYRYNLLDENVRRFNAEVPQIWQWDDHEVTNNWSGSKNLANDGRYTVKDVPLLIARGGRAFMEYAPMRPYGATELERVYRHIPYGPLLDVFVIDMRSYRGANSANVQPEESEATRILGPAQVAWLKDALRRSRATWKVIASDMPIGLNVGDGSVGGVPQWEAVANGNNGPALGRELEIAGVLRAIRQMAVRNVVWLTADVHYCAAHEYAPSRARFTDFDPFWEFVAGPLNAGTFGPNSLDATFGPRVDFQKAPPPGASNYSPYAGMQFFGEVNIDAASRTFTVMFKDLNGQDIYRRTLNPA